MNSSILILVGRILMAVDFVLAGYGKLTAAAGTAGFFGSLGLPSSPAFAYLVGLCELVGGLALIVGFQTRIVAILLGLFCIATGFIAHSGDMTIFMKNVVMAGGFFILAGAGAGAYSVDNRNTARKSAYA